MTTPQHVSPDTLISVKVTLDGDTRRFRIPLRDLTPNSLPPKLRQLLAVPDGSIVVFERYSDSTASFVTLDPKNITVYKTLVRAAKAKLKLRLRASVVPPSEHPNTGGPVEQTAPQTIAEAPAVASPTSSPNPKKPASEASEQQAVPGNVAPPSLQAGMGLDGEQVRSLARKMMLQLESQSNAKKRQWQTPPVERERIEERIKECNARRVAHQKQRREPVLPLGSWSVYCNNCDQPMENEHYHCSVCDNGDYDLCESCINRGIHCYGGDGHWLIKRFVSNGKVINSQTSTLPPKVKAKDVAQTKAPTQPAPQTSTHASIKAPAQAPVQSQAEPAKEMPGAFTEEKPMATEKLLKGAKNQPASGLDCPSRTCNSCIEEYADGYFVTCKDCPDYDLCLKCFLDEQHGHHPAHNFATVAENVDRRVKDLCTENRGVRHAAICDGCDHVIRGVRHKCLNCPDWDYCSSCIKNAQFIHPHHRFVPVYDRLSEPRLTKAKHVGIYCDGPLCMDKRSGYISGVRYKCAICHDTDFCAGCEAAPGNRHNRTHPLIMFKTPVRNVSVTTHNEDKGAHRIMTMGDRHVQNSSTVSQNTVVSPSNNNSTTRVHTVADLEPTPRRSTRSLTKEKIAIKDLLAEPVKEAPQVSELPLRQPKAELKDWCAPKVDHSIPEGLNAHFVSDVVPDGATLSPCQRFVQTWTMRNPGPNAWPVGCSVRYVGGDNMFNIDNYHPFSATEITTATESNRITKEVMAGEQFSFAVVMKAPELEGTAISYWRVKAPNGMAFGHKLWCHVVVKKANAPTQAASTAQESKEDSKEVVEEVKEESKKLTNENETANLPESSSSSLSSQMIFPTLEKESPLSSVHEAATTSPATATAQSHEDKGETTAAAAASADNGSAPAPTNSLARPEPDAERDLFNDAESVEIVDSDSWDDDEEDGFVTDEEWDVLGASDEEAL